MKKQEQESGFFIRYKADGSRCCVEYKRNKHGEWYLRFAPFKQWVKQEGYLTRYSVLEGAFKQ